MNFYVNFNELDINLCSQLRIQNWLMSYFFFIYLINLFIYLSIANARMRRLVCAFVLCTPPLPSNISNVIFSSICSTVSAESAHMHILAIASTAVLYKMINFISTNQRVLAAEGCQHESWLLLRLDMLFSVTYPAHFYILGHNFSTVKATSGYWSLVVVVVVSSHLAEVSLW